MRYNVEQFANPMKIAYIGHACILVETRGVRILMDPWLMGPSNLNAWWHVPPVTLSISQLLPVDYILISHIHDDHFHLPTLQQLPKTAQVMIPFGVDPWMGQVLRKQGFARLLELKHAHPYLLKNGVWVKNFQRGRIDSAYWIRADGEALLNLNDCPVPLSWVRQWRREHSPPDMALSAFSYASPYPLCYTIPGLRYEQMVAESNRRVLENFSRVMAALEPRYAIPFATQYGFLASDQLWINGYIPTPEQALQALAQVAPSLQGVILNPGDELSLSEGVIRNGTPFDWQRKQEAISELARARAREVQEVLEGESKPPAQFFDQFHDYFFQLLKRNRLIRRRIGLPIAFVLSPGKERWVVDCARPSVYPLPSDGEPAPIEICLPSSVLYRALQGEVHWETLYLSNRLKIKVPQDLLDREWDFWRMLFNFPHGIFRDRLRFLTPRGIQVLWCRRQEILELALTRLSRASQREPLRET